MTAPTDYRCCDTLNGTTAEPRVAGHHQFCPRFGLGAIEGRIECVDALERHHRTMTVPGEQAHEDRRVLLAALREAQGYLAKYREIAMDEGGRAVREDVRACLAEAEASGLRKELAEAQEEVKRLRGAHCETCVDQGCQGPGTGGDGEAMGPDWINGRPPRCPDCARTFDGLLGWTCCRCRTFNVEARTDCKGCGHVHRPAGTLASIPRDECDGSDR